MSSATTTPRDVRPTPSMQPRLVMARFLDARGWAKPIGWSVRYALGRV